MSETTKTGYGIRTWRKVNFSDLFSDRKTDRIIGMTFPRSDLNLGLEPSVLTVLPPGENVEYNMSNRDFNDDDVLWYVCSVYISGLDEFISWALRHNREKIVVGGYHPTSFPEDFERYAFKIVQGPCDDFFSTIEQPGQIVQGITSYQSLPRRDLYEIDCNQQIIPDKKSSDTVVSINTSIGCNMRPPCDFCCTPMMCPQILSKPLEIVEREAQSLIIYNPKFIFIRDENFTMQKDWRERLAAIHSALPEAKIYLFASANTLNREKARFMAEHGVYMICLGLEDPTIEYRKNNKLDQVVDWLKEFGVMVYLSFIVDPLQIISREAGTEFYQVLMQRFNAAH